MTTLEKIFRGYYEDFLGNRRKREKKKSEEDKLQSDFISPNFISPIEDKGLSQNYRDSGIDLGPGRLEDDEREKARRKRREKSLEDLESSVGLLSNFLIREPFKEKIYEIDKYNSIISENKIYFNFNKNIKEDIIENYIINYNIPNIINKQFNNIQTSPLGLNLTIGDSASITADNIGEFALPIVEYIHQTQPDYVVASDRGARLLGLAVFNLHKKLYGRFPTADGTIRFRRLSKSNTQKATERHLQPLVDEMLSHKKKPTVLVLDDWVCSGGTKKLAQTVFDKLSKGRIKTKFGVLIGSGGDVSGHPKQTSGFTGVTDWRDDSNIIGVRYGKDDYGSTGVKAQPVRSKQARDYRRRMYDGIDKLVERIVEETKEAVLAKH